MKRLLWLCCLVVAGGTVPVAGGPLRTQWVNAEADWLIHLDVERLLGTEMGERLGREVLDPAFARAAGELKRYLGLDFDWRQTRSLTLYGAEFRPPGQPQGVLLWDAKTDLAAELDRLAAREKTASASIRLVEAGESPLYVIKERVFAAVVPGKPVVLSHSRECVVHARDVLRGAAAGLDLDSELVRFAPAPDGSFLIGAARSFNQATLLPPRAQVLRKAEALRVSLGEHAGRVTANVALKTGGDETSQQVRNVIQGIAALAALGEVQDPRLRELVGSVRVSAQDRVVTVEMSLPTEQVIQGIQEQGGRASATAQPDQP